MLDVTTTITINGSEGERFLASLASYSAPVPRALRWLATSRHRSIEVAPRDAEQIARFVDDLLDAGWIDVAAPPLLYSPKVGDHVALVAEALLEVARTAPGLPPTWLCLPAGVEGKLLGYRERGGESFAIVEMAFDRGVVVYVREQRITRASRSLAAPLPRRGRARRTTHR
ncbi:MAG TPA: hypothetical protein VLB44_24320 [Kofleriaceae bacterium]|nr:hypothetical protein [Kofleriaceae bacterium]